GDAFFFIQHTVSPGNFLGNVRSQREVDGTEAALVFGRPDPGPVRVDAVGRNAENLGIQILEVLDTLAECRNFGGTDKGEVRWIEEEDEPLALVVVKGYPVVQRIQVLGRQHREVRCGLAYQTHMLCSLLVSTW